MSSSLVPTDQDVSASIARVQVDQPDLGAAKLLATIKGYHPEWSLSEKRLRKILHAEAGLVATTGIDPTIDIKALAPKVAVKVFAKGKGKGLVAAEKIFRGEVIWQEEPWIATADR
jgi:hypothetical protein